MRDIVSAGRLQNAISLPRCRRGFDARLPPPTHASLRDGRFGYSICVGFLGHILISRQMQDARRSISRSARALRPFHLLLFVAAITIRNASITFSRARRGIISASARHLLHRSHAARSQRLNEGCWRASRFAGLEVGHWAQHGERCRASFPAIGAET